MAEFTTKKFLDQAGVSTLWSKVAEKVAAEETRAKAAEKAAADAAAAAQADVDALETYVGVIPETYTESNVVAYIQKVATETLAAAYGNSSETAASVKQQLDAYKEANDAEVAEIGGDVATIMADYLKKADKDELAGGIADNAAEILRIDTALKAAIENDGEGLDSIKELATWIETHGEEAAGYAAAITALEKLVGDTAVATQIANAIAAENLAQYATDDDLAAVSAKIDTQGTVTEAINAAIDALKIGDYAKAADLTALATRVTTLETAGYQNSTQVTEAINAAITALKLSETYEAKGAAASAIAALKVENLWDTKGSAATAKSEAVAHSDANLATAKAYTDDAYAAIVALETADIEAAIAAVVPQA